MHLTRRCDSLVYETCHALAGSHRYPHRRVSREIAGFLASVVNPQSDHAVMGQSMAVVVGPFGLSLYLRSP